MQKGQSYMSSQARFGNISKESRDLWYCQNDIPDSLICNSYLGFKLNKLYIFKSWSLAKKEEKEG